MSKNAHHGDAICWACKRPFNPLSLGATATMGPTCAKRAGIKNEVSHSLQCLFTSQGRQTSQARLSFDFVEEHQLSPRLQSRLKKRPKAQGFSKTSDVPKALHEKFLQAKMAFEELMREFCSKARISYGDEALEKHAAITTESVELHSLQDPVLGWLEPEDDLHLIINTESKKHYYWRQWNGTVTLLELAPEESPKAKDHITSILAYSFARKLYRKQEASLQLSFLSDLNL